MAISLQIMELWGVGGFRPPPQGLTDFKNPGLNRVIITIIFGLMSTGRKFHSPKNLTFRVNFQNKLKCV